ncbi:T9SS type A sorting domain-containing protein [Polaribacter sp.]|uniref:T9SS type A sorting domain-containing protein n=1 Tax=Polaribacter sp. TaxID=1920175 RepID=UPI004047FF0A
MKHFYYFLLLLISYTGFGQNVTITKVIETGCADPFVKTVELYVDGTVDFSTEVVLNYMQNGAAWSANQIDISGFGVQSNKFLYIVRDIALMQTEFPNTTFDSSNTLVVGNATNGDDGYQIVYKGKVVSQFGKTETDADNDTESNWNHEDAVATRKTGIPDLGTWDPSHWEITAEQALDANTSCQTSGATNLETYFATLGNTFPLGSGSGWTPTAATCVTTLGTTTASCNTTEIGTTDDTYTATIAFSGGNTGKTFVITTSAGTISGDSPTTSATGTITISNIPEGTDITVTVKDIADGGVCELSKEILSPACLPIIINEVLFDPPGSVATDLNGDANGDGTRDANQDEFIEFFNNSTSPLDVSGFTISDGAALRHTIPASTIIPAKGVLVVFGGGTPTGDFGGAIVQIASEGALNLTNSSDIITVKNTTDDIVIVFDSSKIALNFGDNQSITRSPDITGDFVLHTTANANLLFSPGAKVSGAILSTDNNNISQTKIYPNPVNNGIINIISPSKELKEISIFDISGRSVFKQTTENNTINVSHIKTGLYLLNVTINGSKKTSKIIIN